MNASKWDYKTTKLVKAGHYLKNFYYLRTDGQKVQYRIDIEVERPESKDYLEWTSHLNSLVEGLVEAKIDISAGLDEYDEAGVDISITGWKDLTVQDFPELSGQTLQFKESSVSF